MSLAVQVRPNFSGDDAVRLVSQLYEVRAQATELASERDQNFYLKDELGREWVLKIASPAEKRETLEFQNLVMAHLRERIKDSYIPRVFTTRSNEQIATVA